MMRCFIVLIENLKWMEISVFQILLAFKLRFPFLLHNLLIFQKILLHIFDMQIIQKRRSLKFE